MALGGAAGAVGFIGGGIDFGDLTTQTMDRIPALWRHLPGPALAKVTQAALLFMLAVTVCVQWPFPP
jgi:hypothetical protein